MRSGAALRNVAIFTLIWVGGGGKKRLVVFWEFKAAGLWQLGVV